MAAVDKIYGTTEEFKILKDWIKNNKPDAYQSLYYPDDDTWDQEWNDGRNHPMSNFSEETDIWLYKNCPLDFIIEGITEQYDTDWLKAQ